MVTNDFLPFCPTNTGTNLESQSDYAADSQRTDGNQPGVASSKLNNKAIRQANYITSQFAQFIANQTQTNMVDADLGFAAVLAQINAAIQPIAPSVQRAVSGSGNFNLTFQFFVATANATAGATYTNNAVTFTVVSTVAAGVQIAMRGNAAPTTSGTLTKTGGTGDATITFSAMRAPLYLVVEAIGPGGGGAGGGTGGGNGTAGSADTTFGGIITAGKGSGANATNTSGGAGGSASTSGAAVKLIAVPGQIGGGASFNSGSGADLVGGSGGNSAYSGSGGSGYGATGGSAGQADSGSGGGGSGCDGTPTAYSGPGGGAGGFVRAYIPITSTFSFAYVVGAGGAGGSTSAGGSTGAVGGNGVVTMMEHYQ